MEHDTLTDMELVQIPKEFRPNKHERKSPWAIIIIIVAIIICGIFFFKRKELASPVPTSVAPIIPVTTPTKTTEKELPVTNFDTLEASVGNIVIPDYTDVL